MEPTSSSGMGAVSRESAPSMRWRSGDSVPSRTASRAAPSSGRGRGTSAAFSSARRTSLISADWASSSSSTSGTSPTSRRFLDCDCRRGGRSAGATGSEPLAGRALAIAKNAIRKVVLVIDSRSL